MKHLKINLGIVALVLGMSAAFASQYSSSAEVIYGKLADGTWEIARAGYDCTQSAQTCTATFDPLTEDPNDGGTPSNEVSGTFIQGL